MNQLFQAIQQFWSRMGAGLRFAAGLVVVGCVALFAWVTFLNQTSYVTLSSNMALEDLAMARAKLDAQGINYQLDGTTIKVPSDQVDRLRLDLAVSGLPIGGGKGYEIFDESSLGMSPRMQDINHTRAIQGELERTIKQLDPVRSVRIHIVQPDSTPFIREQKPVTASVVLTPKPGASISHGQVDGIIALVSSSVKGLQREHVTVVDSGGRMLSRQVDDPDSAVSSDQLSHQRDVETHLASKAQDILDRVLGYGQAVVRVSAEMKFQHVVEQSETYSPEGKALHEETVMSSKNDASPQPQGVAGAASNLPPVLPTAYSTSSGNSSEETIESKWLVSKTARQSEQKVGSIERLTIAVMLIPPKLEDGTSGEAALGVSLVEAESLVKTAVGYKDGRDDIQVTIGNPMTPVEEVTEETVPWTTQASEILTGGAKFVVALAIFMIPFFWWRMQKQRMAAAAAQMGSMAAEDVRNLETMAEALRTWVDDE